MNRSKLWHLEAGAGVTMPSAPYAQLELVPDGELNNPGHILVAPRLDNKDGSLTTSVVVDRSRLLIPTVPGGEHLALHLGLEHVLEAGDVDIHDQFLHVGNNFPSLTFLLLETLLETS